MTKKAYVIGTNTKESLSPLIFNYWFKKRNINAEYTFKEIKLKNFDNEIDLILKEKNLCGFNVTIPYKELIIKKLNNIDNHSEKIGAVNCVTKQKNLWVGKNTDWTGFLKPLLKLPRTDIKMARDPVVIGYGGAAKAIIYALKKHGFKEIKVFNRTFEKIKNLNNESGITTIKLSEIKNHIQNSGLIINTTPSNVLENLRGLIFRKNVIAYDIVYKPKETRFLSNFREFNKVYGIDMLVYQAAPCFEEWFGEKAIIDKGLYDLLEKQIS